MSCIWGAQCTSKHNKRWFDMKRDARIIVEQRVDYEVDQDLELFNLFKRLGWQRILELEGVYYPHLVREFYANLNSCTNNLSIETSVQGVRIVLDAELLGNILSIQGDGPDVEILRTRVKHDWTFPGVDQACHMLKIPRISSEPPSETGSQHLLCYAMPRIFVLAYILGHNVTPRRSKVREGRLSDIYHMYCMFNSYTNPPNLPAHIIRQMRGIRESFDATLPLAYPLVLTKVFKHFEVPLPMEHFEEMVDVPFNIISKITLCQVLELEKHEVVGWMPRMPPFNAVTEVHEALEDRESDFIALKPYAAEKPIHIGSQNDESDEDDGDSEASKTKKVRREEEADKEEVPAQGPERKENEEIAPEIQRALDNISAQQSYDEIVNDKKFKYIQKHLIAQEKFWEELWRINMENLTPPAKFPKPFFMPSTISDIEDSESQS